MPKSATGAPREPDCTEQQLLDVKREKTKVLTAVRSCVRTDRQVRCKPAQEG